MLGNLIFFIISQSPKIFVEPAKIEKFYLKGKKYTEVFIVESKDAPSHIEIYFEDFIINEKGKIVFKKKMDGYSLKNLIKVSPRNFDLLGGEKKEVRVSFVLPDTMRTLEKWCMMIIRAYPVMKEKPMIQVVGEIGVPIYAMVYKGNIRSAELLSMGEFNRKVFFVLYNISPVHIRTRGVVLIKRKEKTIWEREFSNMVVLPFKKRRYEFEINELEKGRYKLYLEIDYGTQEIIKGETEIDIR